MDIVARKILEHLGNKHTKVERKPGFMGNYYSPLIDTIYIAENFENTKVPDDAGRINKKAAELIVVCHECIHSVQNKNWHILNTVFANISMLLSIVCICVSLLCTSPLWLKVVTAITLVTSIFTRLKLEKEAIDGSTKLAREVVETEIVDSVSDEDIQQSLQYINKHKWFALTQMVLDKIIFLVLVILIK